MGTGLVLVALLVLVLAMAAFLALIVKIRDEQARRQKVARIRAQMYTAENNVHRIAQQAQAEILRLLRDRRGPSGGADQASR